tara:strand:+ start:12648 stop:13535 length:888 start_codon:yes stop_codon:yes gene_type:complete
MRTKLFFITGLFFFSGFHAEAQLLDKLKQRAEEKGLQTRDVSFDSTDNEKNRTTSFEEEELQINSAQDFFTTDVVMKMYNENGQYTQTLFFDADAIAMRIESESQPKPGYQDRKGLMYAYNESEGQYIKASLGPSGHMGFMMAGMIPQAYKLPPEPYLEAFSALQEIELSIAYLTLELAFIYKPSHFNDDDYYIPEKVTCNGSENCIKFIYNDPDYKGSYILFDEKGRLSELYINAIKPVMGEESSSGKLIYAYQDCTVKLPDAVEQSLMPGPFGKLMKKGLEPWKYNKKDKQKN